MGVSAFPTQPDISPAFFPIIFVGIYLVVSAIQSYAAGWYSLAERYPAASRPLGNAYTSSSSQFGYFGHYHHVVRVIFTDGGVYFYAMFLFRVFHPPFLIPWHCVSRIKKKEGMFGSYYLIEIEDDAFRLWLSLPGRIEDDLLRYQPNPEAIRR